MPFALPPLSPVLHRRILPRKGHFRWRMLVEKAARERESERRRAARQRCEGEREREKGREIVFRKRVVTKRNVLRTKKKIERERGATPTVGSPRDGGANRPSGTVRVRRGKVHGLVGKVGHGVTAWVAAAEAAAAMGNRKR